MRRESNVSAPENALSIRIARSWLRWPCFPHRWMEVHRVDDLACDRCASCHKERRRRLPIDLDAP